MAFGAKVLLFNPILDYFFVVYCGCHCGFIAMSVVSFGFSRFAVVSYGLSAGFMSIIVILS